MKDILKLTVGLVVFYFVFTFACYHDYSRDPYGYWHFLTKAPGWIDDDVPGAESLHWLFPFDKGKEKKMQDSMIAKDNADRDAHLKEIAKNSFYIIDTATGAMYFIPGFDNRKNIKK